MPEWLVDIPAGFWAVLSEMAPYLLFGFLMAGVLSVFVSPAERRRFQATGSTLRRFVKQLKGWVIV